MGRLNGGRRPPASLAAGSKVPSLRTREVWRAIRFSTGVIFLFVAGICLAQSPPVASPSSATIPEPDLGERHDHPRQLDLFPGALAPVLADLSAPLHTHPQRDLARSASASEVDLSDGYTIDGSAFENEKYADAVLADWRQFMEGVMQTKETPGGYPIRLVKGPLPEAPDSVSEAHRITITPEGAVVVAPDVEGLRRAVFRLEDEMLIRRAPILPIRKETRWTRLQTRISRSPIAPYRWGSGWELENDHDYYPEAYLRRLSHCGVNGIWVTGLLRNLVASQTVPELGPKSHQLDKLKQLVEKAARHGIRVYFFCMEPRGIPKGHPALKAHPELAGARGAFCTSSPLAQRYIKEVMQVLFTEVPKLAGVINIFCGERITTCWMNEADVKVCKRCRDRPQAEVLGEMLDAQMEGMRAGSPDAELLAWSYMIDPSTSATLPAQPMLDIMKKTGPEVTWLGNFEHGGTKELFGKPVRIQEYSLSYIGPSETFLEQVRGAKITGRPIYAKLQFGTTYEMSSVPYVPVPGIVYDKVSAATEQGVTGTMLGWIPGGFPSLMLQAAGEAVFEPRPPKEAFLRRLAGIRWGETHADRVAGAWDRFGRAWQHYPFTLRVLYSSPVTRAPAYPLHLETESARALPYNFGYDRHRNPQPFENRPGRWLGAFTAEEVVGGFRAIAEGWRDGLEALRLSMAEENGNPELAKEIAVAEAIHLQCLATANVIEFLSLRDTLLKAQPEEIPATLGRMTEIASQDLQVAKDMKARIQVDPSIGFHSELYAYSYSLPLIDAKIRQVEETLRTLARWEREGIEPAILTTILPGETKYPQAKARLSADLWGD